MILVFGQTGQVARELARIGGDAVMTLDRAAADLSDPGTCAAIIETTQASAIINAAAWTGVDKAESQEAAAQVINADAPAAMARAAAVRGLPFVHISTDYVFPGTGDLPWRPLDTTAPLNAYGRTKLSGEDGVRAAEGPHAILRTSWVFSPHGTNFVKSMLSLGETRSRLTIVADQVGGPTCAAAIARACLCIAAQLQQTPNKTGTYHLSGAPDVSWADFAREIFKQSQLKTEVVEITSSSFPSLAPRPLNSRLDCSATEATFGIVRTDWRNELNCILKSYGALKT